MTLRTSPDSLGLFAGWLPNLAPRPDGIPSDQDLEPAAGQPPSSNSAVWTATAPESAQPASERRSDSAQIPMPGGTGVDVVSIRPSLRWAGYGFVALMLAA